MSSRDTTIEIPPAGRARTPLPDDPDESLVGEPFSDWGTPEPAVCLHYPRHEHGTVEAALADECRCSECLEAKKPWRRRSASVAIMRFGGVAKVYPDVDEVRSHINELYALGWGRKQLARASYVAVKTIDGLVAERNPTCLAGTALRLLAVPLTPGSGPRVPVAGLQVRLRALRAIGWGASDIEPCGLLPKTQADILAGGNRTYAHHLAISAARAYETLAHIEPPMTRARSRNAEIARRLGWQRPEDLDESRLDDPAYYEPQMGILIHIELEAARAEMVDEVEELLNLGRDADRIVDHLGFKDRDHLRSLLASEKRHDLIARFNCTIPAR